MACFALVLFIFQVHTADVQLACLFLRRKLSVLWKKSSAII